MYQFDNTLGLYPQTLRCKFEDFAEDNKTVIKRWSEPWVAEEGMKEVGGQLRDSVVSFLSSLLILLYMYPYGG